ncbi:S8 family serine peptidase, partial [bacterium]|nr:S8 family serine peptidase [bacterium]
MRRWVGRLLIFFCCVAVFFSWRSCFQIRGEDSQDYFAPIIPTAGSSSRNRADFRLVPDTIVVQFAPSCFPTSTGTPEEILDTGTLSVEGLFESYRVDRISKLFRNSLPPQLPTEPDLSRYYKVRFSTDFDPNEVAAAFSNDPDVDFAQVIGIHPVHQAPPNDTHFTAQWALDNTGQTYWPEYGLKGEAGADVGALGAWQLSDDQGQVLIAVVDTGVDWKHPDLGGTPPDYVDGNIYFNKAEVYGDTGADDDGNGYVDDFSGWDWVDCVLAVDGEDGADQDNDPMDFSGHGTHCAGIIGAIADNGIGIAGLARGCKIIPLRAGWEAPDGLAYVRMDSCAEAIVYATDMGAAVILCGWGSSDSGGIAAAADYAISKGVMVVVSAGNDDADVPHYLASREDCIAVAATDADDLRTPFSNYGYWIDISGPGANVISTFYARDLPEPDCHTYAYNSGTSIAAAHVAALIGLIKSRQPDLSGEEIADMIYSSADDIDSMNPGLEGKLGAGRIDVEKALLSLAPSVAEAEAAYGGALIKPPAQEQPGSGVAGEPK